MKKTLSILLVTVATLTMAACGNTTEDQQAMIHYL